MLVPADRALEARFYRTHRVGEADVEGYLALPAARQREEGLVDVQIGLRPVYEGRYQGIEESEDVEAVESLTGSSSGGLTDHVRNVVGDLMTWRSVTVPGAPLPVPYPEVAGELAGSANERRSVLPQVLGDIAAYAYTKLVGTAPLREPRRRHPHRLGARPRQPRDARARPRPPRAAPREAQLEPQRDRPPQRRAQPRAARRRRRRDRPRSACRRSCARTTASGPRTSPAASTTSARRA